MREMNFSIKLMVFNPRVGFQRNCKGNFSACVCVHGVVILCNICVSYNSSDSIFPPFSPLLLAFLRCYLSSRTRLVKTKSESTVRGHFRYKMRCVCTSLWTVLCSARQIIIADGAVGNKQPSRDSLSGEMLY